MIEEQKVKFEEVVKPVIEYLYENWDPHVKIIVTPTAAELLSGECCVKHFANDLKEDMLYSEDAAKNDLTKWFEDFNRELLIRSIYFTEDAEFGKDKLEYQLKMMKILYFDKLFDMIKRGIL